MPLGAAVQTLDIKSTTDTAINAAETEFRLGGGAFTEKLCDACAAKLVGNTLSGTFTALVLDKLKTGAHFVVNRFGTTPCEFQVSTNTSTAARSLSRAITAALTLTIRRGPSTHPWPEH